MKPLAKLALLVTFAVVGLGIAAVGLASGGNDAKGAAKPPPPFRAVVDITFDEWRVDAGGGRVRAGRVTFEERNAGAVEHDLMVVRTDRPARALPRGLEGVAPELAGDVVLGESHSSHNHDPGAGQAADHAHAEEHLDPGGRRRRTVTLEPGRYVLLCPVPGHYERGQATAITVR